jgi:hypothetical protein
VGQTTVRFDDGIPDATIEGRHGYDHYVAGAAAVDSSADPSVADEVRRLHDRGFLSAAHHVTSQVFQVTRGGQEG